MKLEIGNIHLTTKVLHLKTSLWNSDYSLLKSNRNYGSHFEETAFFRGHGGNNNNNG